MIAAGSDPFIGKLLAGTYQVARLIGKGGMGAIYEATHTRLQGKRYAIKVLAPHFTEEPELLVRFRREAEIASQLGHDNIVAVHDFNVADGQAYMVMELLEGEDLAARLSARGALPVDEVKRIVDHVASALDSAHRAQIVHRDLKPQNIFLCRRVGHHDHVKVLDFGISKVLDSSLVVTRAHALIGTPFYMSPEQADGRVNEIDARTDVFALGAITWEMLAGRMAFAAPTLSVALYKVCSVDPPDIHLVRNDVPPALSVVLRRALAKERQARTPSVVQMAAELAAALHGIVPAGLPPPAYGGQVSTPGFPSLSHGELSMAVAGSAAVPPPQPGHGWANPISASPIAPSGALASNPRLAGLLPTMPSLSGAPLAAVSAHGHAPTGGAQPPGPMVSATGSMASPPAQHLASAPGMSSLAVGSVMFQRRSWGRRVAVPAGVTALVLGLATWAVTGLGATGSSPTPASPTTAGAVAADPPALKDGSGAAAAATGVGGPGATGPNSASSTVTAKPSGSGGTEAAVPTAPASAPTEKPSAVTPPRPTTAPEVALFLVVEPAGAKPKITVGDRKVTDRLVHVPRSATPLTLTAEARGFVTYHGDVWPDRDQTVAIVLKRKAAKTAPARIPTTRSPAAATRAAPAASSPAAAATRAAQEPSPPDAAKRGAPTGAGVQAAAGAGSPQAGSPQAGEHTGTPGLQQVPAAPPRAAVPLPPPPAPPKKKKTIFDQ